MHVDLLWLEALLATVEHGSFQTAALKLGVSRATLRSRVEALESHVGLPLLVRTVKGVEVTDLGGPFLLRAKALLAEATALARFADEQEGEVTGELRICVPVGTPPQVHALALAQVRRRYPGVRVHFEARADPATCGPEMDFVLHFCPRVTRGDFHTVRLFSFPMHLVASAAYLAERGAPRSVAELAEHALLSWIAPGEDGTRWPLRAGGHVAVQPAVRSPDIGLVRSLVSAGLGLALVPDAGGVAPLIGEADLVPVLPSVIGKELSLWMLMPTARTSAGRTRAVVEITREIMDWVKQRPLQQP